MGSRKSMEAGGAGGRRQERRGNTCHSSPGLTVLDASSSRGQIRTGMDTKTTQSGRLELSGVGETGTHQGPWGSVSPTCCWSALQSWEGRGGRRTHNELQG